MRLFHREPEVTEADHQMAKGLGLTSLAIGLTEIMAPRKLSRIMGLRPSENVGVIRALGVREIMHGVDLLAH
jgi:hypothetical protein